MRMCSGATGPRARGCEAVVYSLKHGEMELLRLYRELNDKGKEILIGTARTYPELPFFKKGVDFYAYQEEHKEQPAKPERPRLQLVKKAED